MAVGQCETLDAISGAKVHKSLWKHPFLIKKTEIKADFYNYQLFFSNFLLIFAPENR